MTRTLFALMLAAAALNGARAAETPAPAPLSVEEATAEGQNWGFDVSPSGRYLASIHRVKDSDVVIVVDLQDEKAPPAVRPIPDSRIDWVEWAGDDRLLVAARFWLDKFDKIIPAKKFDDPYVNGQLVIRLFAMNRTGGPVQMLFADNNDALRSVSLTNIVGWKENRQRAMIPGWQYATYDLLSVDVNTGKSQRVAKGTPRTFQWFTDNNGDPAFRIDRSVSGKYAFVFARKGPADLAYDEIQWEKVQSIRLAYEDNQEPPDFWPVAHGPEPNTYYVAARPEGADTVGIYLYDYVQQKYVKTIAVDPNVDIGDVGVDGKGHLIGVNYYADRKVHTFVDPKAQAYFKAAERYFGGEVDTYLKSTDDEGKVWLLYTTGPRDRGSWHVYRLKDKYIREMAHYLPALDPHRLGAAKVLRYKARDGLELTGYLTLPPGHKAGDKPPLVLVPHGGPMSRDTYGHDALVQLLVTRGYQVFQPNFRGSSGFGKRFVELGFGTWGTAMQDDLTDGFDFLVKEGYAAKDRACIVGASYGGYAALAGATLTPDKYRCAVSVAGVSHLRQLLKYERRISIGEEDYWITVLRQIGDPGKDKEKLDATSPANLAMAVKIPILLIHGTRDTTVPIEQSEMMEEALRNEGKDVRFIKIEEMWHSPNRNQYKKVYPPILEFLDKHLPVGGAPPAP